MYTLTQTYDYSLVCVNLKPFVMHSLFTDMVYSEAADGLKYYDVVVGKGRTAEKGSMVKVCPHI